MDELEKADGVDETQETSETSPEETTPTEVEDRESRRDERIRELNERVKNAEGLVVQQSQIIQNMQQQQQQEQEQQPEDDETLDPEVRKVKAQLRQSQLAVGALADQNDLLLARTNPDIKDYGKYAQAIEGTLRQMRTSGRNSSRTEIYWWLKGQEAGKTKPPKAEVNKAEGEDQSPIPETKRAKPTGQAPRKPKTLEEEAQELSKEQF